MNFSNRLLNWFDENGRKHLPWQQDTTQYRVWISEIMLQQTQVATVIPYYEKFTRSFPSIEMLAQASEDAVLHHWTGLGYYARARNLHKTARQIVGHHSGQLPLTVDELATLPGIGKSTAGAIVAICTDTKATILDGNVKRVLSRYFAIGGWPATRTTAQALWEVAEQLTPERRVADYTQAIMDLGATLCTRSSPDCGHCPFEPECLARQSDTIGDYPGKKPKKKMPIRKTTMLLIENPQREWLLQRRPAEGLWGGLWSFPENDVFDADDASADETDWNQFGTALEQLNLNNIRIENHETLDKFRHTFTHFHLDITPVLVTLAEMPTLIGEQATRWYSPISKDEIGLTGPVTKLLKELN
jgi:A/G-specific adenine glycosylase